MHSIAMKYFLESERLILRPWKEEDAEPFYEGWANDPEVTKFMTWNPHRNVEETKKIVSLWVEQYEKKERINFAIERKDDHELIGGIDVVGYLDGIPVLGYMLKRKEWNKGYMSEACRRVLDFLFSLGHEKVRIDAIVENIGSNKVIEKCGGIYIGREEQERPLKGDKVIVNRYFFEKQK